MGNDNGFWGAPSNGHSRPQTPYKSPASDSSGGCMVVAGPIAGVSTAVVLVLLKKLLRA